MQIKTPKIGIPTFYLLASVFCIALAGWAEWLWGWLRAFTGLAALVFFILGVITLGDWIAFNFGARLKEINFGKVYGLISASNALKGLTTFQSEAVLAGNLVSIDLVPTDDEPALRVRGLTRSIPWEFVEDFFILSMETDPFLFPERESNNKEWATDLTNLIVNRGWAKKGTGSVSARIVEPLTLSWIAARFWVELPKPEPTEETEPVQYG